MAGDLRDWVLPRKNSAALLVKRSAAVFLMPIPC